LQEPAFWVKIHKRKYEGTEEFYKIPKIKGAAITAAPFDFIENTS
jgi:hypothetical protein